MEYYEKAIKTLEFDKILNILSSCCPTTGSKELALRLRPEGNPDSIRKNLRTVTDAKDVVVKKGFPPFSDVTDLSEAMERAAKGGTMTMKELRRTASLMTVTRRLYEFYFEDKESLVGNTLSEHFGRLCPDRRIEDEINRAIIADDMIADEASPLLSDIRRKMRLENAKIRETLSRYAGGQFSSFLRENIVTMRNGRYVVPVKAECKNDVKGLVHDTSASGSTYFIEPLAVVEGNNELRALESAEEHEIDRILSALTSMCYDCSSMIMNNYHAITYLSFVFGKAELSFRLKATEPEIVKEHGVSFINARHPLIDAGKVVPTTIKLGGNGKSSYDTMIITGPNTGGKTVALKTLGLLSLMAQAGLHVPADDGSQSTVFDAVLADIGDEQSIEQNLSTFSAHMVNTVDILSKMTKNSLVLFDELGAGTDPTEGAALAEAIIENVRENGSLCAATTHYAEIKAYALETEGVINASCEFDVNTLRPTYRLIIGTPGKSNAFAISEKLGLPSSVIERAKNHLTNDDLKFEDVLQELENNRIETEKAKKEAEKIRLDYEKEYAEKEKAISDRLMKAERTLEQSREKATAIINSARATEEFVLDKLEKIKKEQDKAEFSKALEEGRSELKKHLRDASDSVNPVTDETNGDYVLPRPLQRGDGVYITNLKKNGTVTVLPDKKGNLFVSVGSMTTRTNIRYIKLTEEAVSVVTETKKVTPDQYRQSVSSTIKAEIDVRGENSDEAWDEVDRYIDEALLANLSTVTVIHGKGSGILRKNISEKLSADKRVKSFRAGKYGEGDTGVTVINLK